MASDPEAERQFDAHTRADARFASTFIAMMIGQIRSGFPIDINHIAMLVETQMPTYYSSNDPVLDHSLRSRAHMLTQLMRDARQDAHNVGSEPQISPTDR